MQKLRLCVRIEGLIIAATLLVPLLAMSHPGYAAARREHQIEIALTVDDLPGMGALPAGESRIGIARDMIRALKTGRVPAYGFANGIQLDADPPQVDVLKEWANAGFPIGNHTFSHPNLAKVDARTYIADIERMDQRLAVLDLTADSLSARRTFRYPYMAEGDTIEKRDAVRDYLIGNRYRIAEVTLDYHDWAWNEAYTRCLARNDQSALDLVRKHAADSAMHHLNESIGLARMLFGRDIRHILLTHMGALEAAELGEILRRYRLAGVKFISLRRAMEDPVYALNPNYAYAGTDMTFLLQIATARKLSVPFQNTIDTPETVGAICN